MEKNLLGRDFPFADGILDGKTALVCGASKGIGRATALVLARAGCRVIACARSVGDLDSLIEEMHGSGHEKMVLDMESLESIYGSVYKLRYFPFQWPERPSKKAGIGEDSME